tara:strand:+ start:264 stop:911 length:648 start_codon:yes stop_codon:yes gene_type:complete
MGGRHDLCSAFLDRLSKEIDQKGFERQINDYTTSLRFDEESKFPIKIHYPLAARGLSPDFIEQTIQNCTNLLLPISGGSTEHAPERGNWLQDDNLHVDNIKAITYDVPAGKLSDFSKKTMDCITTIQTQLKQEAVYVSIDGSSKNVNLLLAPGESFTLINEIDSSNGSESSSDSSITMKNIQVAGMSIGEVVLNGQNSKEEFVGLILQLKMEAMS